MLRKCSHCGYNGHNSRTCLDSKGGFKLFGVRVSADCCASSPPGSVAPSECSSSSLTAMRKSVSMGNLSNYGSAEGGASPLSPSHFEQADVGDPLEGYASDDLVHTNSSSRERKKGVPWVEEEHRAFLLGLQKLGKGDWRGISRNFVKTRTPTQVASHAQKYFLRRNNLNKRRRRSSLFDITADTQVSSLFEEPVLEETGFGDDPDACPELSLGQSIPHGRPHGVDASQFARHGYPVEYLPMPHHQFPLMCPPTGVPYTTGMVGEAAESRHMVAMDVLENGHVRQATDDTDEMEAVPEAINKKEEGLIFNQSGFQLPNAPVPLWPGQGLYSLTNKYESGGTECKIVKPTPMIPRPPRKVEDAAKISKPASNLSGRVMEPSPLSYRLQEEGSRHSAFHMASASDGSSREVDGQSSLSNAISVS